MTRAMLPKAGKAGPDSSLFRKLNVEDIAEGNTVLAHTEGCGAGGEIPLRNEEQVKENATSPPTPTPFYHIGV